MARTEEQRAYTRKANQEHRAREKERLASLTEEQRLQEKKSRSEKRKQDNLKLPAEAREAKRLAKNGKQKTYREENPEKVKASKKADYEKNRHRYCRYQRQYRIDNADYLADYWAMFYIEHADELRAKSREASRLRRLMFPEEVKFYQKQYQFINREAIRQSAKAYRKANFARISANEKEWCKKNPEKKRASRKANALNRRNAPGKITAKDVRELHAAGDGLCAYCLKPIDLFVEHLDHVTPLARGGYNIVSNIVTACEPCNLSKGTRTPLEFMLGWSVVTERYDFVATQYDR